MPISAPDRLLLVSKTPTLPLALCSLFLSIGALVCLPARKKEPVLLSSGLSVLRQRSFGVLFLP